MPHDHGPEPDLTGREIADLRRYVPHVEGLSPPSPRDVPTEYWEQLRGALALVDRDVNAFMDHLADQPALVQIMALKTQLHVDLERLPDRPGGADFERAWTDHISSVRYLLQAYDTLFASMPDTIP